MKDLTTVDDGNPSRVLQEHYELLMAEDDPARLAQDIIELVRDHSRISVSNLEKLVRTVRAIGPNLEKLQYYVTNYILAGSGLGVARLGRVNVPQDV